MQRRVYERNNLSNKMSAGLIPGPTYKDYIFNSIVTSGNSESDFQNAEFKNCTLNDMEFLECTFQNCEFFDCDFQNILFYQSYLFNTKFHNCSFKEVKFQSCDLGRADFSNNNLGNTIFDNVKYDATNFQNSVLENSEIKDIKSISFWNNELSGSTLPQYLCNDNFEVSHELGGFIGYTQKSIGNSTNLEKQKWEEGSFLYEILNINPFSNCGIGFYPKISLTGLRFIEEVWQCLLKFEDSFHCVPNGLYSFRCSKVWLLKCVHKK